jgi:pyruvate formate lyase activating enzyme
MTATPARFFDMLPDGRVKCALCGHACVLAEGAHGICGGRRNEGGRLVTEFHGTLVAEHVDPIEKKPFFHVLPGSRSYSIAVSGCNFRCAFCQNAAISQHIVGGRATPPEDVVAAAVRSGCGSIAYTYTEPTLCLEYALETAALAHRAGLRNLFVTNGYQSAEALDACEGLIDAANVDLKSFSDEFYRRRCGARLAPVLAAIAKMRALGVFLELTTLVIPGENDSARELGALAEWIAALSPDIPWHVSRFHPAYRLLDRPPTPVETLRAAREAGIGAGLRYVYVGNIHGCGFEDTCCPGCGARVIEREGFTVTAERLRGTRCAACDRPIPLVLGGPATSSSP